MLTRRQKLALRLRRIAGYVGWVYFYYGPVPRKHIVLDVFGIRRFVSHLLYKPSQSNWFMQTGDWSEIICNDNLGMYRGQY